MSTRQDSKPIILERTFFPKGSQIIREGDYAGRAFLVQAGEVSVTVPKGSDQVEVARMGVGEIVGELGVLHGGKRSANVYATKDTTLIVMNKDTLEEKLSKSDPTVRALVRMLTERIIKNNASLVESGGGSALLKDIIDEASSVEDLEKSIKSLMLEASNSMDGVRARAFQAIVKPEFDKLLKAIKSFEEEYPA